MHELLTHILMIALNDVATVIMDHLLLNHLLCWLVAICKLDSTLRR